jgi:hypothetical protein
VQINQIFWGGEEIYKIAYLQTTRKCKTKYLLLRIFLNSSKCKLVVYSRFKKASKV